MKNELESRFPIPGPGSPEVSTFDTKPKAVDRWLDQLPLADGGRTAKIILSAIEQVNSHDCALEQRLHFLDSLSDKVSMVSDWLRNRYLPRELPLTEPAQAIALLDYRLMVAMALGYRIALARMPNRGIKGFLSRKKLERLPNCILGYFGSALLIIEECALNYPQGLWDRIHALYQFAVDKKLNAMAAAPNGRMGQSTAESTFKGILLLSLAGVHQFPRLEADQVIALISKVSLKASLRTAQSGESAIIVDLESDRPPVHSARQQMRGERLLTLETAAAISGMDNHLAAEAGLSTYTVARLRNRWSPAPDRVHPRLRVQKEIRVLPGLTHIYRYLAAINEPAAAQVVGMQTTTSAAIAGKAPAPDTAFTELYIEGLPAYSWSRYVQDIVEPAICAMVDMSPGGYRVRLSSADKISLKLGDVVATQECGDASEEIGRWPIGIIRWVSSQGDQSECGIQLISPYAVPVHARRQSLADPEQQVEGLLLPCPSSERTMCTILLPGPHLKEGEALELHYGQKVRTIALGPVQDHGHGFTAYAFTDTA